MIYRLFIEGKEIEVNEETIISITKQFSSLTNPTLLYTEWTKTVKIPFTESNDIAFGGMFCPDKQIITGGSRLIDLYFDPSKKLDFYIEYNNERILSGYGKMNSIIKQNGYGYYEFTLYGSLGKIFQEIKNITFDKTQSDSNYFIDGSQYVDEYITKDLVKSAWESTPQQLELDGASTTDIIGFGLRNTYNQDFDSKSVQIYNKQNEESILSFQDIIENADDPSNKFPYSTLSAESVIGDGLLPRQFSEYRSYYQPPFIFWNKLWQIFWKKAEQITGYKVNLDGTWFNNSNPYYTDLCYMLKPFEVSDGEAKTNSYALNTVTVQYQGTPGMAQSWWDIKLLPLSIDLEHSEQQVECIEQGTYDYFLTSKDYNLTLTGDLTLKITVPYLVNDTWFDLNSGLIVTVNYCTDDAGRIWKQKTCVIVNKDTTQPLTGFDYVIKVGNASPQEQYRTGWYVGIPISQMFTNYELSKIRVSLSCAWINPEPPFRNSGGDGNQAWWPDLWLSLGSQQIQVNVSDKIKRSFAHFDLNDLWNMDYNLFDQILNYCKIFRLVFDVDDIHKEINIKRSTTYFKDYIIEDWTDKIDYSKDFKITPLSFEKKYAVFNYKDSNIKRNAAYKDRFGVNYSEKKINTDYAFNNEAENLFENPINISINSSENILPWEHIYGDGSMLFIFTNEVVIDNANKEKQPEDNFGAYYFYDGPVLFDPNIERLNTVSDDTVYQSANSTYCYNAIEGDPTRTTVNAYTRLINLKDGYLSVFNTPMENYTYWLDYEDSTSIYDAFWDKYLNDVYDTRNRKIECYIYLKPRDFLNFRFNKFIRIDNNLYLVNKITDYNPESTSSVKCELVQIHNIKSYTEDDFFINYFDTQIKHIYETGAESSFEYPDGYKVPFVTNYDTQGITTEIEYSGSHYGTIYCSVLQDSLDVSWTHVIQEEIEAQIIVKFEGDEIYRLPINIQGD